MKKKFLYLLFWVTLWQLHGETIYIVDNNLTSSIEVFDELSIGYGSKISKVIIENENFSIKKVILEGTAFIKDFSFLSQCKNLEVLVMNDIKIDNLFFLERCKKLKIIAFDSISFLYFPDLHKFKNLEYLSITNSNLTEINNFTKHRDRLKWLNFCNNKIKELPKLNSRDSSIYFISGNDFLKNHDSRFYFEKDYVDKLPKDYLHYLR